MKISLAVVLLISCVRAESCKVWADGAGCRSRQLAMQPIREDLPGVGKVRILPRDQASAPDQLGFSLTSRGKTATRQQLIQALGRRAAHYHVLSVRLPPSPET